MKKIFIIFLSCFIFLGCSSIKEVEVHQIQEQKLKLDLKDPEPLKLKTVRWKVINQDKTYYCLDSESYKNLSINMNLLQKYMIEQREIINSYRLYYESNQNESSGGSK